MRKIIFDIETDGLYDTVTKLHCLSYIDLSNGELKTLNTTEVKTFLAQKDITLIGHNIVRYDIPVLEKLYNLDLSHIPLIDTLGLSWYLHCNMEVHGLEHWGKILNIHKIEMSDWENLSFEQYKIRCEQDVRINLAVWDRFSSYLDELYEGDYQKLIDYTNFKLDCLKEQEINKILCDVELLTTTKERLIPMIEDKIRILSAKMPLGKIIASRPKVTHKKDGSLSAHGEKWLEKLRELNLPLTTEVIQEQGNPCSHSQLKSWLIELGWQPITFKTSKATGENVPQVSLPFGAGLCPSVKDLFETHPFLEELDGLFMLRHRLGLVESFFDNLDSNNMVTASASGFTNTMRLTHRKPICNLPDVGKPFGKEIRGSLIVEEEDIFVAFDVKALEDTTKQHYMYFFDPEVVDKLRVPGFDPHLNIAVLAGFITEEDSDFYKDFEKLSDEEKKAVDESTLLKYKTIGKARKLGKQANFSMVYGAGIPKVADTTKLSIEDATKLYNAYWKFNMAVKETAKSCIIKSVKNQQWLYNPISSLWMFLKTEKDAFSTINQSSGVFCFDTLLYLIRKRLGKDLAFPTLQYHDEVLIRTKEYFSYVVSHVLKDAVKELNEILNLNVPIEIDIKIGKNYAECH